MKLENQNIETRGNRLLAGPLRSSPRAQFGAKYLTFNFIWFSSFVVTKYGFQVLHVEIIMNNIKHLLRIQSNPVHKIFKIYALYKNADLVMCFAKTTADVIRAFVVISFFETFFLAEVAFAFWQTTESAFSLNLLHKTTPRQRHLGLLLQNVSFNRGCVGLPGKKGLSWKWSGL